MNKSLMALGFMAGTLTPEMDAEAKPKASHEKVKTAYPEFWVDHHGMSEDVYVLVDSTRAAFFYNFPDSTCVWIPEWSIPAKAEKMKQKGTDALSPDMKKPECDRNVYYPGRAKVLDDAGRDSWSKSYQPRGGWKETFADWKARTGGAQRTK